MTSPQEETQLTPLTDLDNVKMVPVEPREGYTVEDAYRMLAGLPLAPVDVTPEE